MKPNLLRRAGLLFAAAQTVLALHAQTNSLATGEAVIGVNYSSGQWTLNLRDTLGGVTYSPATNLLLWVEANAHSLVPTNAGWAFLGDAGSNVWIVPKTKTVNLLHLGFDTTQITNGLFTGNQVKLTLQSISGPGDFSLYDSDANGNPTVLMNTGDGLSAADQVTLPTGTNQFFNWAFSAPGDYVLNFAASGNLAGGSGTSSGAVAFLFHVQDQVFYLTFQHMDFRADYEPDADGTNRLNTLVRYNVSYEVDPNGYIVTTNKYLYIVGGSGAQLTIPNNPYYTFLGQPGSPVWILPQTQDTNLPYVGISTEEIPPGVFNGPLSFELVSVDGPGNFFAWANPGFGQPPIIKFICTNGVVSPGYNVMTPSTGSHEHYNWAFSTNGLYRVTFRYSGQLAADGTYITGRNVTWAFEILPLRAWEQWVSTNWLPATGAGIVGAGADPDGDGIVNVLEYAFGNNPNVALRTNLPALTFVTNAGTSYGALRYIWATNATDVSLAPVAANSPAGPWTNLTNVFSVVTNGTAKTVTVRDSIAVPAAASRFYQLRGTLNYP
ncbi:MAG: choice-of-anchor M domain-containing protein [Verrucomicrobiota bacterium]